MKPLRIALVVHGRFFMFDLARELHLAGHDVRLFTNYPSWIVAKFGFPENRVTSFLAHGVGSRILGRMFPRGFGGWVERITNTTFSRWAAKAVTRSHWDVVACMSGVALDLFRRLRQTQTLKVLERASAHIRVQQSILEAEAERTAQAVDGPTDWIVRREEAEYEQSDLIQVPARFALDSFRTSGVANEKLSLLPLGVDVSRFRVASHVLSARLARVNSNQTLRVLNVGVFSHQKGAAIWDELLRSPSANKYEFRFVGAVSPDSRIYLERLSDKATFINKVPQNDLPMQYEWGDIFVLPTLQDGFPVVLTQALAAGLPLITTPNCSGPDLIQQGVNGWIVPAGDPVAILARLGQLDTNREMLAAAIQATQVAVLNYDWSETAKCFVESAQSLINR